MANDRGVGGVTGVWLTVIARLVPVDRRAVWLREWRAELDAARRDGRGAFRLALGVLPDAWAVRWTHRDRRGGSVAAGAGTGAGPLSGSGVELRRAFRSLRRSPGFTAASVITLGAGLGATAAIFTLVDGILLRPLPYPDADRLVRVEHTMGESASTNALARFAFALFEEENRSFDRIGGYWAPQLLTLAGDIAAERVVATQATPGLFDVLGGRPVAGRLFTAEDASNGSGGVVIGERLWLRRYGGDPSITGTTVLIEGEPRVVLGVVSRDMDLPERDIDLWIPYVVPVGVRVDDAFRISAIAHLADGVSLDAARADLDGLTRRFPEMGSFYATYIDELGLATQVRPLRDEVVGDMQRALWILLAAVSIVLLVAAANVAMLFLVRAEGRRAEVAVRAALGAGRPRLALSFLTETTVVVAAAGIVALLLAQGATSVLVSIAPPGIPRLDEIQVRGATLGLVAILSAVIAVALALYPALRFGAAGPGGSRGAAGGQDRRATRTGSTLVVAQVALALVLLSGASLLLQTWRHLKAVDPGFDPAGVLVASFSLPASTYPERPQVEAFQNRLLEQIEALPGVRAAALGPSPLSTGGCNGLYVEGMQLREGEFPPCVPLVFVGPGYFDVLGIPVVAGRSIENEDLHQPPVAVVTENVANRLWQTGAVGQGVNPAPRPGPPWFPVIGVTGAVRARGPDQPLGEALYLPIASTGDEGEFLRSTGILIATREGNETALAPALRRIVIGIDPNVPLTISGTLREQLDRSMVRSSFMMFLLVTAATTALILGLVGLYGVVAYRVETRRPEIGVRMAMGAQRPQVRAMVLGHSLRLVATGTAIGLAAAALLTRTLSSLLFGVRAGDPWSLAAAALALTAAATIASWIPAQRATRVDPARALRSD